MTELNEGKPGTLAATCVIIRALSACRAAPNAKGDISEARRMLFAELLLLPARDGRRGSFDRDCGRSSPLSSSLPRRGSSGSTSTAAAAAAASAAFDRERRFARAA